MDSTFYKGHYPVWILSAGVYTCARRMAIYAMAHEHPFFQFYAMTRGHIRVLIEGKEHELGAGRLFFLAPFVNHGDVPSPARDVELIQIKFDACPEWSAWLKWIPIQPFYHGERLRQVAAVWNGGASRARIRANLELARLLLDMADDRRYRTTPPRRTIETPTGAVWLKRTLRYVWESADAHLTVRELARRAGMQEEAFSRSFHGVMGFSPKHFLMRVKNEKARKMLSARHMPCKVIAATLGFKSQSHFNRFFHQMNGKTPGQWLKTVSVPRGVTGNYLDAASGYFFAGK